MVLLVMFRKHSGENDRMNWFLCLMKADCGGFFAF